MLYSPQIEPITELHRDPLQVLEKLRKGPVFLTQRSQRAAVMISPEQWDRIVEQIEALEDAVAIYKTKYEVASGKAEMVELDDTFFAEVAANTVPA
jgi:prevent-host-death family protein